MGGCSSLSVLPTAIGALRALEHLDLENCRSLKGLPPSIGNLDLLDHLDLSGCQSIRVLPNTICGLVALRTLDVSNCLGTAIGIGAGKYPYGGVSPISLQTALDNIPGLNLIGGDNYPRFESRAASGLAAKIYRGRRQWSRRTCDWCGETVRNEMPPFKRCGACRAVRYCTVECQRDHWEDGHREICSVVRARRRRTCDVCGAFAGHNQPSFSVCGACGKRRYCGEACQIADWEAGHARKCGR